MRKLDGRFHADGESLAYSLYLPDGEKQARVLSLHGAGPAGRERIDYLARHLVKKRLGTMCFDFSGHGESTGRLRDSSLLRRASQAKEALAFIDPSIPSMLIGTSMGGHVALDLLGIMNVSHLMLFCPALYGDNAVNQPFDHRFSSAIRVPHAYENSSSIAAMRAFQGKAVLLIGENDPIIPERVIQIYQEGFCKAKQFNIVRLPGAPHMIHRWVLDSAENLRAVTDPIDDLLTA